MDNLWIIMVNIWNNNGILCIYIYILIWVNYNDLTATEPWESWLVRGKGNHPLKWPSNSEGIGTSFPVATLLGCACELCHVIQLCSTPCPIDQPHQDL